MTRATAPGIDPHKSPQVAPASAAGRGSSPKIYFGPVYIRHIELDHFSCVLRLLRHPNVVFDYQANDALLDRARAKSLTRFLLDSDADVWLTIDGDIVFDDAHAQEICEQAMTHDVVCGQYVTRSRARCFPTSLQLDDVPVEYAGDPTPIPIKWAATGFLAIHRRVVEKLVQRPDVELCHPTEHWRFYSNLFTPFAVPGPSGPIYLSEDYALCERIRDEGFQIHVNPSVRILHVGQYAFSLEDAVYPPPDQMAMQFTRQTDGRYKIETPVEVA